MKLPLQVTFRNFDHSQTIQQAIEEKSMGLEKYFDRITACRVMVEAPHLHKKKGKLFHVRVDLTIPGHEILAARNPAQHASHADVFVAVRDAFRATRRQLEDVVHRQREGHRIRRRKMRVAISEPVYEGSMSFA